MLRTILEQSREIEIAGPLAHAFASTFVWAVVLLAVAFLPALAMAFYRRAGRPVPTGITAESPMVLD